MSDLTDTENKILTHTMDTSSDQHEAAHNIIALEKNELDSTTSEKSIGT